VGGGSLAGVSMIAASAPSAAMADTAYVPVSDTQAANAFKPVFTRTLEGRPAGSQSGFWIDSTTYAGTTDPCAIMGHIGASGDWVSTIQIEADWDCAPDAGHITEMYWQIVTPAGESRRPMYGQYDKTSGRAGSWWFMIGNGKTDTNRPGSFNITFDANTNQVGKSLFSVKPNRINLYGVTADGTTPDETRLALYSSPGQGSSISMTWNGSDAEGVSEPTMVQATVSRTQVNVRLGGVHSAEWFSASPARPVLALRSGVRLGDGNAMQRTMFSSSGAPSSSMGSNGDWCASDNGHLYTKVNGSWVAKV
jgi:hypothetical protein